MPSKKGLGRSIGVLVHWLSSTGSKMNHKKKRIDWSIGVLLRWLSPTGSKIRHRKMGVGGQSGFSYEGYLQQKARYAIGRWEWGG